MTRITRLSRCSLRNAAHPALLLQQDLVPPRQLSNKRLDNCQSDHALAPKTWAPPEPGSCSRLSLSLTFRDKNHAALLGILTEARWSTVPFAVTLRPRRKPLNGV